jgi:hypothetical protein
MLQMPVNGPGEPGVAPEPITSGLPVSGSRQEFGPIGITLDDKIHSGPQFLPFRLSSHSIHPPRIIQAPQFPGYGPGELGVSIA